MKVVTAKKAKKGSSSNVFLFGRRPSARSRYKPPSRQRLEKRAKLIPGAFFQKRKSNIQPKAMVTYQSAFSFIFLRHLQNKFAEG